MIKFKAGRQTMSEQSESNGFTIVELLVVIVVIGILAAIIIVSYIGISQQAKEASLKSDLDNGSKLIKLFQVAEASGNYPTANVCPTPGATEICLKPSGSNTYTYTPSNGTNPKTFTLDATNGTTTYRITNDSTPVAVVPDSNWITIGTQVWAKYNLNVGTMVTTAQTNNSILEKYCSADTESNCTTYGALYQWDEAMQYVTTEGAQGICPAGSNIPTDSEWTTLETYLGSATAGTQLQSGGSSGLNMPLAGYRNTGGSFYGLSSYTYLWSSSESSTSAWVRLLASGDAPVSRYENDKGLGVSVRCLGN